MASKFQFITELYSRTLTRLTGDYENWTGFLRSACYNYKCPFDEQVLIYAQRPDATAVLELEKWNRQFGRWVNAGATGIAVMDEAHGKGRLKHYFDITDTHATRISRPVPIWSMEPAYTEPVIETLEATFGTLAEKDNLPEAILSASRNAVADNMQGLSAGSAGLSRRQYAGGAGRTECRGHIQAGAGEQRCLYAADPAFSACRSLHTAGGF